MNTDYAYLNQIIKDGKYKLSVACIKVLIKQLNAKQKAYKHILEVDFNVCIHTHTLNDGTVLKWNPIQGKLKLNSHKLSILYSALNILDGKPTNHISSDLGVAINDVLPTLIKIFDGTEYLDKVKSVKHSIANEYFTKTSSNKP